MRGQLSTAIRRNTLIALLLGVILWLSLWPFQLREQIERQYDYPKDIWVFRAGPFAEDYPVSSQLRQQAEQVLNGLLRQGRLAVEAGGSVLIYAFPKLRVSHSMFELGLVRLIAGEFVDRPGAFLAQHGGPYALGEKTDEGVVTGLVELVWRSFFVTDVYLLQGFQDDLSQLPEMGRSGFQFFLRSASPQEIGDVLTWIQVYTGRAFSSLPLYDAIAESADFYALETYQIRLQRLAVAFLLICTLLTIYSDMNKTWFESRESYRIERVLGRTQGYFLRRWLSFGLHQWLWGILLTTTLFIIWIMFRHTVPGPLIEIIITWFLGVVAVGLIMALGFALLASRFPLARASLDTEQTWTDRIAPVLVTFSLVFGVTYLFATTLNQWAESTVSVKNLGPNRVVAWTTPAAKESLPTSLCQTIAQSVHACSSFGLANVSLWGPNLGPLQNETQFNKLLSFFPEDAEALRLSVLTGRLPRKESREVVVADWALSRIRSLEPGFGVGSQLQLGYRVVGIVKTPVRASHTIFDTIFEAPVLVPAGAPQMDASLFLSPSGRNGLVFEVSREADLSALKTTLRSNYRDLEFIEPSAYAKAFASVIETSLFRLAGIFVLAFLAAALVYHNFIAVMIARRREELVIWRMMGMSLKEMGRRLQKELLPLVAITGLLACFAGVSLYVAAGAVSLASYALGCGLLAVACSTLLSLIMLRQIVKGMQGHEISSVYRKLL